MASEVVPRVGIVSERSNVGDGIAMLSDRGDIGARAGWVYISATDYGFNGKLNDSRPGTLSGAPRQFCLDGNCAVPELVTGLILVPRASLSWLVRFYRRFNIARSGGAIYLQGWLTAPIFGRSRVPKLYRRTRRSK